ncbi:MAG TPA: hypothetical protein G4N95_05700 [Anaerolineae bacterium]|nr:hypothetical protein [Anaerolineae bacterium]
MAPELSLNQVEIGIMIIAFLGFCMRYLFDSALSQVLGVLLMTPATAWLSQVVYTWTIPWLGWSGWVAMVLIGGTILAGVRGSAAVVISLIIFSYGLWIYLIGYLGEDIPIQAVINNPVMASMILVGLIFAIWGIIDVTRQNAILG